MKSKRFLLVLLVMVLAFGMTLVGCDNGDDGSGGTDFDGTWIMKAEGENAMKIVASNGSLKVYGFEYESSVSQGGGSSPAKVTEVEQIRGTYTVSGNTVNVTITQINTGYILWDGEGSRPADSWTNYTNVAAEIKEEIPQTMQGTISDKQLVINGGTFTKQ